MKFLSCIFEENSYWHHIDFFLQDEGNRHYLVGNKMVKIRLNLVNKLKAWGTHPFILRENLDQQLTEALIISCVGTKHLELGTPIDKSVMDFVKRKI